MCIHLHQSFRSKSVNCLLVALIVTDEFGRAHARKQCKSKYNKFITLGGDIREVPEQVI